MSTNTPDLLSNIPSMNAGRIAIRVKGVAEDAIRNFHPWLFADAITHQSREGKPGDIAVIFDKNRNFLAVGFYDPTSPIRVRILAHLIPTQINRDFFLNRIVSSVRLRKQLLPETTGYRLVHGENDRLPGLVIDRYNKTLIIKLYTAAWLPHLGEIIHSLGEIIDLHRILLRFSRTLIKYPESLYGLKDGDILVGSPIQKPILFKENGLVFESDPIRGHKTGFYLDQRENRTSTGELANGKRVLNVFSYTGGFSVYSASGGAKEVTSLDISKQALDAAKRNFQYNLTNSRLQKCKHKTIIGNAFETLPALANSNHFYDMIIIDPPSFANKKSQIEKATHAYKQLTRLGINLLNSGGILIQSSCSSRITADEFFDAVHLSANEIGHSLKEIKRSFHPIDHPTTFKEGAYLKCIFATVL